MKSSSRKKRGGVFSALFRKQQQPCDYIDQITTYYNEGLKESSNTGSFINQIQSLQKKCTNSSKKIKDDINNMLNELIEKKTEEDEKKSNEYLNSSTFTHGYKVNTENNTLYKEQKEPNSTTGGKYKKRSRKNKTKKIRKSKTNINI